MAKQDFAQVKASTHTESGSGSGSILSAIGIVAIAGLCFSGGYWLGAGDIRQTGTKTDTDAVEAKLAVQVAENKILQAKNESLQALATQWKARAEQGAHAKVGELTFYKELPKQSVTPAPVPDTAKVKTQPGKQTADVHQVAAANAAHGTTVPDTVNTTSSILHSSSQIVYRIQLASFRSEADAMVMQKKLTRAGFISQVKKADLGNKGQWFRLYAGPYDSRTKAEAAQQNINAQVKVKGFIIRDK